MVTGGILRVGTGPVKVGHPAPTGFLAIGRAIGGTRAESEQILPGLRSEEVVSRVLQREIVERGLGPGSRLPTERELAEVTGLGRTVVRRALGLMEADGRLIRQVGRGTYLALDPASRIDATADFEASPIEIMTVRALFEPQLMPLAVMSATSADFAEMARCLQGGRTATDYLAWEAWDRALHGSLATATHNRFLIRIGAMIASARTQPSWGGLKYRNSTEERRELYRGDHRAIVTALVERDPVEAQTAMRHHLQRVRSHLLGDDQAIPFVG